jgi:hypothetical protein
MSSTWQYNDVQTICDLGITNASDILNFSNVSKVEAICFVTGEQQAPPDEFKYDVCTVYFGQCG